MVGVLALVTALAAAHVTPAPRQLSWQHEERTAFIHFGPNTYTGREVGLGTEPPSTVNPSHLDTDGWMHALHDAGFTKVVLVTKHHDGLVLWPTRYTNYSIARSTWRGGRGDIVKSFVDSAHKFGLGVGFYLSPADLHEAQPGGRYANGSVARDTTIPTLASGDTRHPAKTFRYKLDDYNAYYLNTLYELLTQYGRVDEVWLDGFNPTKRKEPYAFDAYYSMIRTLAPNAVIFGGPDLNWIGNEDGVARETQWSTVAFATGTPRPDQTTALRDPSSPKLGGRDDLADPRTRLVLWYPSECDARLENTWFWHPNQPPKSLAELQSMYFTTVGRNCQLLLDVPPDKSGQFDAADTARLREFGTWIHSEFGHGLAEFSKQSWSGNGTTGALTVTLSAPTKFRILALDEQIEHGQRVERFAVDALIDGSWKQIAQGTTIGYKRLLQLPKPLVAQRLRVRVLESRDTPEIGLNVYR